jgi:hypothetical protein
MRILRGFLLAGVLAWALAPEIPRYAAERMLRLATDSLRYLVSHPGEVSDPRGALDRIQQIALAAALDSGDSPARARGILPARRRGHRRGSTSTEGPDLGEPEIDLNAGAHEANGETEKAAAAFLRAVWISPALAPALLPDLKIQALLEYQRLEAELRRAGSPRHPSSKTCRGRGRSGRSTCPRCGACQEHRLQDREPVAHRGPEGDLRGLVEITGLDGDLANRQACAIACAMISVSNTKPSELRSRWTASR